MKFFPFLDTQEIRQNMEQVIAYAGVSQDGLSLKGQFMSAIQQLQGTYIPWTDGAIEFEFANERTAGILAGMGMLEPHEVASRHHLLSPQGQRNVQNYLDKACGILNTLHPGLYYNLLQLIGAISVYKKPGSGGGSVSTYVGHIWISPIKRWTVLEYGEALYHEFIHNSLFLDDMVHRIFLDPKRLGEEDALVTSAILKIRRPLDRSFHAACVAIGLMHYYWMLHDETKAESFKEPVSVTIKEINEKTSYLGDRGKEILQMMNDFLARPDYETISEGLLA